MRQFDGLQEERASEHLAACCGSSAWVAAMLARRPFRTRDALMTQADLVAHELGATDWLEAFSHHPRIGETRAATPVSPGAAQWSSDEQAMAAASPADLHAELAAANAEYEQRFGFIFIICANGRSAGEILGALRERIANPLDAEIAVAAREQQRIARLRLGKLIAAEDGA